MLAALLHPGAPAQTLSSVYPDDRSQSMSGKETEADRSPGSAKTSTASSNDSPQIQDNSFLIEEAYNQAFGVVQHIQNFQRFWTSKDWVYTFTQEWPVDASPRHQLSYTLTALHSGEQRASGAGFGDVILNYRYQVLGNGESKAAFAPRLSVLLPTGDYRLGRGAVVRLKAAAKEPRAVRVGGRGPNGFPGSLGVLPGQAVEPPVGVARINAHPAGGRGG